MKRSGRATKGTRATKKDRQNCNTWPTVDEAISYTDMEY